MRQQRGFAPYLKSNERRNITKNIRYSKDEFEQISTYLAKENITFSELVRMSLAEYLKAK
ncbi:MAG: hypothetical protein WD512_04195 [Candidatus Paceibacterota bacterium]